MKLAVHLGGFLFPRDSKETREIIDKVFTAFPSNLRRGDHGHAEFLFVSVTDHRPFSAIESSLMLDMSLAARLGVATWSCDGHVAQQLAESGQNDLVTSAWVSRALDKPPQDGSVFLDYDTRAIADPRSVLPFSDLRSAVEEYCISGTGVRPDAIHWAAGTHTGQLLEPEER